MSSSLLSLEEKCFVIVISMTDNNTYISPFLSQPLLVTMVIQPHSTLTGKLILQDGSRDATPNWERHRIGKRRPQQVL